MHDLHPCYRQAAHDSECSSSKTQQGKAPARAVEESHDQAREWKLRTNLLLPVEFGALQQRIHAQNAVERRANLQSTQHSKFRDEPETCNATGGDMHATTKGSEPSLGTHT